MDNLLGNHKKVAIFVPHNLSYMIQNYTKTRVVGVDISIDITTFAIIDVRGNIIARSSFATTDFPNVNEFVAHLCNCIVELIEANGGYDSIRSVGVSAPNANNMTGNIESPINLHWTGSIPLAALMRDRLGLAVSIANDSHVRALGEMTYGCARGMKDFIYVILSNGFGSCAFSQGRVHRGNNGFAGEVGHCLIVPDGRLCNCGRKGCLETYCAGKGIALTAQELLAASSEPSLLRDCEELTPKFIADCCDKGDQIAIEVYKKTGFMLGIGLANYATVFNPEAIVLSGGVVKAGKWLLEPTNESFEAHVFHNTRNRVKIMTSSLKSNDSYVLGSSVLAWGVKEYSLFK